MGKGQENLQGQTHILSRCVKVPYAKLGDTILRSSRISLPGLREKPARQNCYPPPLHSHSQTFHFPTSILITSDQLETKATAASKPKKLCQEGQGLARHPSAIPAGTEMHQTWRYGRLWEAHWGNIMEYIHVYIYKRYILAYIDLYFTYLHIYIYLNWIC